LMVPFTAKLMRVESPAEALAELMAARREPGPALPRPVDDDVRVYGRGAGGGSLGHGRTSRERQPPPKPRTRQRHPRFAA